MTVQQIENIITLIMALAMVTWIIAGLLYYPTLNWLMLRIMLGASSLGTIAAEINAQIEDYGLGGENYKKFAIAFIANFMLFIVSAVLLLEEKEKKK